MRKRQAWGFLSQDGVRRVTRFAAARMEKKKVEIYLEVVRRLRRYRCEQAGSTVARACTPRKGIGPGKCVSNNVFGNFTPTFLTCTRSFLWASLKRRGLGDPRWTRLTCQSGGRSTGSGTSSSFSPAVRFARACRIRPPRTDLLDRGERGEASYAGRVLRTDTSESFHASQARARTT